MVGCPPLPVQPGSFIVLVVPRYSVHKRAFVFQVNLFFFKGTQTQEGFCIFKSTFPPCFFVAPPFPNFDPINPHKPHNPSHLGENKHFKKSYFLGLRMASVHTD